jgi:hypothetical protein
MSRHRDGRIRGGSARSRPDDARPAEQLFGTLCSAALKDRARRRFPAHLDVRAGSDGWWGDGWPMFDGKTPTHTFDRNRGWRDWRRERNEANLASELRSNQLSDLHSVQRRALTQVVVGDEQSQPAQPIDARILAQPTDEARVSPGGLQRSGDVA